MRVFLPTKGKEVVAGQGVVAISGCRLIQNEQIGNVVSVSCNDLHPNWRTTLGRLLAMAVVVLDVVEIRFPLGFESPLLALTGLVGVLCLSDGHVPLLGLRSSPINGWRSWCRLGLICFLGLAVLLTAYAGVWWMLGWKLPIYRTPPSLRSLIWMCLYAPVVEETIYRSLLAVALTPTIGVRGTIVVSGLIFAWIHVLRGNPSPENLIGGLILAWAFFRSGTILVPITLHSAGNFFALAGQVAGWYWFPVDR